jgi:hypothetical protein
MYIRRTIVIRNQNRHSYGIESDVRLVPAGATESPPPPLPKHTFFFSPNPREEGGRKSIINQPLGLRDDLERTGGWGGGEGV